ncbi:hypothetical protein THAOC_36779, partial [Thalassiosira oceanica]
EGVGEPVGGRATAFSPPPPCLRRTGPLALRARSAEKYGSVSSGGEPKDEGRPLPPRADPARPGRGDRVAREEGRRTRGRRRTAARPSPPARATRTPPLAGGRGTRRTRSSAPGRGDRPGMGGASESGGRGVPRPGPRAARPPSLVAAQRWGGGNPVELRDVVDNLRWRSRGGPSRGGPSAGGLPPGFSSGRAADGRASPKDERRSPPEARRATKSDGDASTRRRRVSFFLSFLASPGGLLEAALPPCGGDLCRRSTRGTSARRSSIRGGLVELDETITGSYFSYKSDNNVEFGPHVVRHDGAAASRVEFRPGNEMQVSSWPRWQIFGCSSDGDGSARNGGYQSKEHDEAVLQHRSELNSAMKTFFSTGKSSCFDPMRQSTVSNEDERELLMTAARRVDVQKLCSGAEAGGADRRRELRRRLHNFCPAGP